MMECGGGSSPVRGKAPAIHASTPTLKSFREMRRESMLKRCNVPWLWRRATLL